MSSKKFKVPSSARRHIKIEQFTQFVSSSRLRHVQSVIAKKDNMDGILCLAGIDSRYNEGSLELLNYLLFGFFDVRKDELEKSGFAEEVIDDLMILVCREHAEIYCNPVNYHYLLPYVSHWPSVQFHCLADNEYEGEDDDASEEFKIKSLIAMVSNCKVIGIPYSGRAGVLSKSSAPFNPMAVEKWPIIQAFALEDFGGGGFFTLKHEVCDVSQELYRIYNYQDPVTMEILLTEHFPLMSRQWENMMKCVQIALTEPVSPLLPAKKIAEPLKSYFNHGLVGQKGREGRKPFVLVDSEADKKQLRRVQAGEDCGDPTDVKLDALSTHTVMCQAVSPHSPLVCARTYFLTSHPYKILTGNGGQQESSSSHLDLRYYVGVYLAMVHAVLAAVERYAHTSSVAKARQTCMEDLTEGCSQVDTPELRSYLKDSSDVDFTLEIIGCDNSGEVVEEGEYIPLMKYICLTLHRIPPPPGCSGGKKTLMFAESFLDSRLFVRECPDVSSDFLIVTSCVPRFHLWSARGHSKKRSVSAPALPFDHWGEHLMTHDDIEMATTWPALLPPEKVVLTVWEHGLSVESHSYGSFMIHGSQMKSVSMYDGNSMTQVALLSIVLRPNATLREQLPPHLLMDFDQMGQCQILLAVSPHSKAHTQLYGSVLPQWKENSQVPEVERPECLDGELWPVHSFLQHKLDSVSKGAVTPLKKVACTTPELFDYLQHLSMSSCLQQPINRDVFHSLTSETQKTKDYDKIIVTIITGTPGSEKERLGTLLTTYNKNVINWLVYKQPEECRVDSNFLYRSMTSAVESRNQWKLTKITRVIFIAPGFCDTSAVVGALQTHPDPNVRSEFIVGAVTVCIDPLNTFMVHKMTLPAVTAHCAQGWVNNIVFTSQTQAPSELLDHIQMLVRSINSNVALLKAENGEVKRSTDLDLIMSDSAFQEPEFEKARLLMKPVGALGRPQVWPCQPVMNDVMLRFTQPLEKHLTLIKLRNIKSSLKSHPFEGNIYYVRGYLAFSGSPTLVDLQFTPLSGKLSMVDSQSSRGAGEGTVYIISFTGVKLKEAELKTFLEACVKQKPQKKKLLTRSDLTKKDIDKVHSEHHLDELPEGWFYNGSQFVSMTGERSLKHPSLESFVQEFLDRKNADIEKFNARVDSEEYVNLFP